MIGVILWLFSQTQKLRFSCIPSILKRKQRKMHNIKNKSFVAIFCGANMNFDRLRHVSERSELGELNEMLIGVTIPEQPGSFKNFCSLIGKKSITEFNYRFASKSEAHVFAGIKLTNGIEDKKSIIKTLKSNSYKVIDLTICDEAHHCAGRSGSYFSNILYNEKINSKKRIFMTATPKYIKSKTVPKNDNEIGIVNDLKVASMDDNKLFGEVFYELNFSEAIEKDLLNNYRIEIIGITDKEVLDFVENQINFDFLN